MADFDLKKSTRKCFADQRDFEPGEPFFTVLVEATDGSSERRDFCRQHWQQPGESECIGWWKSQVPEQAQGKIYWAPRKVLLAYFEHVLQQPESRDLAYVMALLLVQKKILVIHDDGESTDQIQVRNRLDKTEYQLPVCELPPDRMAEIQEILGEQLFVDQPFGDDEDDADQELPDD